MFFFIYSPFPKTCYFEYSSPQKFTLSDTDLLTVFDFYYAMLCYRVVGNITKLNTVYNITTYL